ncbi:LuxR C-terminal-related transcriptional regulator [Vibrio diazotrophicus]|uniref:LuxR C-terminal-related transcriptional regulator n=1 Tax=Vibrio diazotrophicus TaxID=685 RepID=UPI0022AFC45C|nr:LuxR C-terminal-related transcriptional regulator [Vibrio diazotrophicus]MCZ4373402.1 LuxR C-terminal-related transcriptional regulator [Vibrio diazotrophicus]
MIIKTKLYIPEPKSNYVVRQVLSEKLKQIINTKLTLVSAPAGFGKSNLVADWCSRKEEKLAWLSLDSNDKNTDTFLSYLIAAFREVDITLAQEAWDLVQVQKEVNADHVITSLINELAYYQNELTLILDDYHLASSAATDSVINNFLARMPENIHLVLITRSDPSISLARLRAEGELIEIRSSDLKFTDEEAGKLLSQTCHAQLEKSDVVAVNRITEGWAVGLQLSSLALNSSAHPEDIITRLSGTHTYILDYLTEQVLSGMNEKVRHFLRETFFLKELSVEFCNHVLNREDCGEILTYLESNNIFLISLDNERNWYRYHHLFADVLRIHAHITEERMHELNMRAAAWMANKGRLADAVQYVRCCGEKELLRLLESHWPIVRTHSHDSQLIEWLASVDIERIQAFPVLAGYYSLVLLPHNPEQGIFLLDTTKEHFERCVTPLNDQEKTTLGIVNIGQAYIHAAQSNTREVLERIRNALNVLPTKEQVWRGSSRALEGIALWRDGEVSAAERSLKAAVANMDRSEDISAKITSRFLLGDFYYQFGWLTKARSVVESAIDRVDQNRSYTVEGSADVYLLLSEIEFEQGNIESALSLLDTAQQFGTSGSMQETKYRYPLISGRIASVENRIEDAIKYISDAEALYVETPNPCHRPPSLWKGIILLNQGSCELLTKQTPCSTPFHINSLAYLTYLIAQPNERREVTTTMNNAFSEDTPPTLQFVQKVVCAIDAEANKDKKSAEHALRQAVLLMAENGADVWHTEIRAIHELFTTYDLAPKKLSPVIITDSLVEPLSVKETQVLQWLDTELSGPQIASKLFVSLNTLRTHTKNIYSKLGVSNRRAAINKAKLHKLLS